MAEEWVSQMRFQSTPPVRGATLLTTENLAQQTISIHAPRAGGDKQGEHPRR